jgi:transcriptional regulator with XRE-family HTH domain
MPPDHEPRLRLRQYRLQRDMTQQDVAEQLSRLAWVHARQRVGVNADMVAKWERGAKRPSKLYRRLLCTLFESTERDLGLAPDEAYEPMGHGVAGRSGDVLALLDELGEPAALLHPRLREMWRDELLNRRALLTYVGLAPVAVALDGILRNPLVSDSSVPLVGVDVSVVEGLEKLAARYHELYHSADPSSLMAPVKAHLAAAGEMLAQRPPRGLRVRLLRNHGQVALLAGRLSFFDLQESITARGYYQEALEAALEVGDELLAATALGHAAFVPAAENHFVAATDYLQGAALHAQRRSSDLVLSWLAAIEAEIRTTYGDVKQALTAVDRAETSLDSSSDGELPLGWDFYDATRLKGFRGFTELHAGRLNDASRVLEDALAALPATSVKQRAVYAADLAEVRVKQAEVDDACRLAAEAAESLSRAGYAIGNQRLRKLWVQMEPWRNHPGVRQLEEQLRAS